jgi:lysophospholipid acyltransferase (LPLAT)-like uncharacterized protein
VTGGVRATALPVLAAGAVRALGATLRMAVHGLEHVQPFWTSHRPVIYVVWHGRVLLMPWINAWLRRHHGGRSATVLVSLSRDGEMAARYARRFGLVVARGSSSRGGVAAVRVLAQTLREGGDVALVPDGPRGPQRRLQPGAVVLAGLTRAPIVPLACGARPARRLGSWDEMLVPAPFARCAVVFGAPLPISPDADRGVACKDVERALEETTAEADRLVAP